MILRAAGFLPRPLLFFESGENINRGDFAVWYYVSMWIAIGSFCLGFILIFTVLFRWAFNWYWKFPVPFDYLYIGVPLFILGCFLVFGAPKPLVEMKTKGIRFAAKKLGQWRRESALWNTLSVQERKGRYLDFTVSGKED